MYDLCKQENAIDSYFASLLFYNSIIKMILILRRIELFKALNMLCLQERFQQSLKLIKEQDFSLTEREKGKIASISNRK